MHDLLIGVVAYDIVNARVSVHVSGSSTVHIKS